MHLGSLRRGIPIRDALSPSLQPIKLFRHNQGVEYRLTRFINRFDKQFTPFFFWRRQQLRWCFHVDHEDLQTAQAIQIGSNHRTRHIGLAQHRVRLSKGEPFHAPEVQIVAFGHAVPWGIDVRQHDGITTCDTAIANQQVFEPISVEVASHHSKACLWHTG